MNIESISNARKKKNRFYFNNCILNTKYIKIVYGRKLVFIFVGVICFILKNVPVKEERFLVF